MAKTSLTFPFNNAYPWINNIANPTGDAGTSGWATYADTAAVSPVDGTGGSPTVTFAASTSTILRGSASLQLSKPASNCQGQGVSYDFLIDNADKAKPISISFDYNFTGTASSGAVGSNSDVMIYVYDITNAVLIPVSPAVLTVSGTTNAVFKGTFQTAINSTSYRLIAHIVTTSATAWNFTFDNVVVGPQPVALGVPVTDWVDYNLVVGAVTTPPTEGTGVVKSARWRRVGDSIEIRYNYNQTGAGVSGSGIYLFPLPNNLQIDITKVTPTTGTVGVFGTMVGSGHMGEGDVTAAMKPVMVVPYSASALRISTDMNGVATQPWGSGQSNSYADPILNYSFEARVPVVGWSSNVQMSQDTDTRVVAARYTSNTNQSVAGGTILNFDIKDYDTHGAVTTGASWKYTAQVSGYYRVTGNIYYGSSSGGSIDLYKNGSFLTRITEKGAVVGQINGSTSISLNAGDYMDLRSSAAATTLTLGSAYNYMNIERISGPSAIAATESINARYFASVTALSGSLATINWTTKDFDSHLGMSSGTYIVPTSGKYQVQSSLAVAGTFALNNAVNMQLQKNGTAVSEDNAIAGGATTSMNVNCSDIINCLAGDTIRVQVSSSATTPTIAASNSKNFFSIARVGN